MAGDDKKQPIVKKKIVKGGGGHHGGSWKVAYADFVTAMMAFFLLLWLLGITDEMQRNGISDWFKNPAGIKGPGGASTSMIKLGGTKDIPKGDGKKSEQVAPSSQPEVKKSPRKKVEKVEEVERKEDRKRLDKLMEKLKAAIENSKELRDFKDQLLLQITPDGLRIQIIDKKKRPMFALGKAVLKSYTKVILRKISKIIVQEVPNLVSITGHTDATPFPNGYIEYEDRYGNDLRKPYSNWELSADRANAARRELLKGGMPSDQLGRIVGLASSVLLDRKHPRSPRNRRISILIMNKSAEEAMRRGGGKVEAKTRAAAVGQSP